MNLPLPIEFAPMEADTAKAIPQGPEWQYEPKWDGFRALCYRDGDEADIRSKAGQPLARYFTEMVQALRAMEPQRFVLDGEIIVVVGGRPSFDQLLQRIHPAESRIKRLAHETPSSLAVFDLLVNDEGESLVDQPLRERRKALEDFAGKYLASATRPVHLSPVTSEYEEARRWFTEMAGGLDGVIAKRLDCPYGAGQRNAMLKIKNLRSADCVVGGFRYAQKGNLVGSMLLGLFDDTGLLHHVGFSSSFAAAAKPELTSKLEALVGPPGFTGNAPGGPSRWSTERSTQWVSLRHELVVEVQYDHFTGGRFRHGTKFLRWRPDKAPAQCRMEQVEKEAASPLDLLR
ncbi:MAG TPA: ATP-dependent DNA ligase [Bryobacteraceae bacterium]|nr:ATP-dependent DNA ligase [Bryobacteraceae bacterium]